MMRMIDCVSEKDARARTGWPAGDMVTSGSVFNVQTTPSVPQTSHSILRQQSSQHSFGQQIAPRSTQQGQEFVSKVELEILRAQLDEVCLSIY